MTFGLEKKYKKRIDAFILQYPYTFYVYGSRAKGTAKLSSDLDLCIFSEISLALLGEIKEGLNNLMLPFTIDVTLWHRLSDEFKSIIKDDLIAYCPDPFLGAKITELSYPISKGTPSWPGKKFDLITDTDYDQLFRIQTYSLPAGFGTHIDAPAHMISGGKDLSQLELRTLYAPCSLFILPEDTNSSFLLTDGMIKEYERDFGPIPPHSWFLVMTGWGKKSSDAEAYQNIDSKGLMHFPKISEPAAEYLLQKKIIGLGVDTLSPDGNATFPVHKKLLSAGIYIVENLMYYAGTSGNNYFLQVVPLAIAGGTESPVRVLLIKQNE